MFTFLRVAGQAPRQLTGDRSQSSHHATQAPQQPNLHTQARAFLQVGYQRLADAHAKELMRIDFGTPNSNELRKTIQRRLRVGQHALLDQADARFGQTIVHLERGRLGHDDRRIGS